MNVLLEIWTKVQDKEIKGKISTGKCRIISNHSDPASSGDSGFIDKQQPESPPQAATNVVNKAKEEAVLEAAAGEGWVGEPAG